MVSGSPSAAGSPDEAQLPLMADGTIRLLLLSSGELLMARLRTTTDSDGQPAYQLIRPRRVQGIEGDSEGFALAPFLSGLTPQSSVVLFKHAVASVLEPDGLLLQAYAKQTSQECPLEETPVERLKRAFQEFTESFEG
tara:strand:+ start:205 stop:618 length:414 start_codon:yes stop_codon:yes gene_type:complete